MNKANRSTFAAKLVKFSLAEWESVIGFGLSAYMHTCVPTIASFSLFSSGILPMRFADEKTLGGHLEKLLFRRLTPASIIRESGFHEFTKR